MLSFVWLSHSSVACFCAAILFVGVDFKERRDKRDLNPCRSRNAARPSWDPMTNCCTGRVTGTVSHRVTNFFEIRAKLPCGLGTWPAIWMLGTKGAWPDDGEIDIMEHVGKNKGQILGSAYSNYYNWANGTGNTKNTTVADACDAFHNYQLYWDADQLAIGVDGKYYFQFVNAKTGDYKKWPFDQPQYLLLNLAIGGDLGGAVDDNIFPSKFEIDYVRVYQK